ncbi:hypothetical protein HOB10_04500 [Candidatus Parcubacteria bacterium]|jgi:hypothetical protein|nr:hypothetical protein [Candidatus Parcubacteria bacterium]
MTIRLTRSDGKLGVDFDSPQTLQIFLDFILENKDPDTEHYIPVDEDFKALLIKMGLLYDNPETRHFIPILKNGGVIPRDDEDFQTLLIKMGIMDWDIPNSMRGHFLVAFQRRLDMKIDWYIKLAADRQRDFQAYLEKRQKPIMFEKSPKIREREFINQVILPILRAEGEFNEHNMEVALGQRWSMSISQLLDKIWQLWLEMTSHWHIQKVAKLFKKDASTIRRWARSGRLFGEKNHRGHWYFTHEVLIDQT